MNSPPVKIGILNFQGAAQDHISHLKNHHAGYELVRNGEQLQTHKRVLATTFHPELTGNSGFHKWFIREAEQYSHRRVPAY